MKFNRYAPVIIAGFIFAAVLFLFRLPLSGLLNTIIVTPIFSSFERSIWSDIVLVLLLIATAYWITKEQIQNVILHAACFITIFYCFQRLNPYWEFIRLSSFPQLMYWDLIVLAIWLTLSINFLLNCGRKKDSDFQEMNKGFIEDQAVTQLEDDHFKRQVTAAEIARQIKLTKNRKSFAIGILGEYGSGKTSFLNLINLEFNDTEVLKISFDPWVANNPDTIRKEFFDLLASEAAAIDARVSSLIYSYGRKLASFDGRSQSFMNWLGFLQNRSSVQSSREYEKINQILKNTKRKIIITIDDLDRLYPIEIMEVLKLIRNTANFSNIFYLVGYDKEYVQRAINTLTETKGSDFLDKIFQLEIPLPKCEEDDFLITLKDRLKSMVSVQHYEAFETILIPNDFRKRYEKAYSTILRQGRDIVRFLNSFKIIYNLIGEEVEFESLILLELIKFRYPTIYRLIYMQSDVFLEENPVRSTHEQYLSPRLVKAKETDKASTEVSLFKTHLEQIGWLTAEDVSLLDGLFMRLFKGNQYHRPTAKNSISYPLYFDIYFQYRLSPKNLSDKNFKAALTSDSMQNLMRYCASSGLHKQLMVRLMQENISINRQAFEDIIAWIFMFGTTYVEKEGMHHFDYDSLLDKIYNYNNIITKKLYKNDIQQYKDFLHSLFTTAAPPFLFVNELLYYLKEKSDNFIISIDEMVEYQYSYFTKMAESGHGLSENTLWLFWGARQNYEFEVSGTYYKTWRFEPRLVSKMKSYIASKDSIQFLKFSIAYEMRNRSHVSIHKPVLEMFDKPADYRVLIAGNDLLNEDVKNEYLHFFDKLSLSNFEQCVDIEFKTELKKKDSE
ncbi:P-loop NTPase fold protein [Chitinophaga sp. S165]|uniref:KAP family P-loop NTPase fold protein n=1 Tax=Chitinophaga sp. S165 TaxID=2135462 RepID=UPI000D70D3B1|nr:P-loop NTPase fold protein [Chitinophaga sp. S165]PWV44628.1 KAP-like P-loop domain-containing protein [Chitinophaga sp. S165]